MALRIHVEGDESGAGALGVAAPYAHWLLRVGLASVFLYHGLQKFLGTGIGGFATMMGLPPAIAGAVAVVEVLAGAGVIAGATAPGRLGDIATRIAGLAIVPIMLGAIALVHWGQWSFVATSTHPLGGMEFQVVLALLGLYFALRGNSA